MNISSIEEKIGYHFSDPNLLIAALVHRSYLNEKTRDESIISHNERLEFLGDAVLELIVTDYLYTHIHQDEGVLSAVRSSLVNFKQVGNVGVLLTLDEDILISKGEREELGKARLTIVADAIEAIIGAMYLDGGIAPCTEFIQKNLLIYVDDIISSESYRDAKSRIQELCQKHLKITPHYGILESGGKDHEKIFTIGLWVGKDMITSATGRSKREAETKAAEEGYNLIITKYSL